MASTIAWTFTPTTTGVSYNFGDTSNPETNENVLTQRLGEIQVPRRHGVYVQATPYLGSRLITLKGSLGGTVDALRTALDDLVRQLMGTGRGKLAEWDAQRFMWATARSVTLAYREGAGMQAADFAIEFLCDDPFWYSRTTSSDAGTIPNPGNLVLGLNNIDNTGHIPAATTSPTPPLLTMTSGAGGLTAFTATLGTKVFSWTGSLTSGQILVVDMGTKEITAAGVATMAGLGLTSSFFDLPAGASNLTLTASSSTGVTVSFVPRFA